MDEKQPNRTATMITGFTMLLLTIMLIVFSEHGYHATVGALKLFFEVVFPSLLPFFILSDVLLSTGMVHYLGVWFEPLMRPLFNVPGVGSFVFSMGLAAGYPMDAVLTAKFRKQGLCTKTEGERLLAFSNSADPLFIFGAVAVGMFGAPALGAVLALAHYASVLMVGLTFRFYRRQDGVKPGEGVVVRGIHQRALDALMRGRAEDGRSLGQVLNEAITDSISTLFMIMSFMVLFAVLIRVLTATGLMGILEIPFGVLLRLVGLSPHLVNAAMQGFFEIDLGSAAAAHASAPLIQRLVVVSAIIAWSGLSVHGQVASVLADTDISMKPYFVARALHAVYAGIMTVVLFRPVQAVFSGAALPAFAARDFLLQGAPGGMMLDGLHLSMLLVVMSLASLALGALLTGFLRQIRRTWLALRYR
ncbi:MAG: sporulation integral membrane protein YlbJ [Sulfobacillus acidophilus]|uniref:Sporulation integral membrane protein YlbJ n=1 Tax=Sulfobacillus acidophilus TaxID=53633 RepID=A0A2T2WLG2_9FIRM|nr:MAG: sporulation integral membrane protein YlbJ [Sulfobacillus acidophilus]